MTRARTADSTTVYFVTVHAKRPISGTVLGDQGPHDDGQERFHDWLVRQLGSSSAFALPLMPEGSTHSFPPITVYAPPGVAVSINSAVDGFSRIDPQTGARPLPTMTAGGPFGGGGAGH